ncbi:MAG: hypothetical protein E7G42_01335 [Serratia marcescens]|uniref:hypothetical protein n=1 Tax=Pantoea eucrina TaxID=472693 RepID=UPI0024B84759|nr:hypothetical protein [Pantoea eucrina]MDJ0023663.1 hypothetical protein [Pantoea eucrina]MDU3784030.1 hypothetical protein [Serratia marcescens]MDU3817753.1 hypothetical protein [Pantoea sp.]
MNIPPLPLASRPGTEIQFRQPVMKDALKYSTPDEISDERRVTEYLNHLQEGPLSDSRDWTAQERRTALWWIMINSRADNLEAFHYTCEHCREVHTYDFDLSDLAETVELLTIEPYERVSVPVNGVATNWTLKPLTGRGQEMLERLRVSLPDADAPEYEAALVRMRIAEFALCTALDDDPEDFEAAANRRFDIMENMVPDLEFAPLVAHIQLMQRNLRHGLRMQITQGQVRLLLPPTPCEKEGMQMNTTQLFIPFRSGLFIPKFSTQWMANHH